MDHFVTDRALLKATRYRAVLFDFDGTLVDTWPGLGAALQELHQQLIGRQCLHDMEVLKQLSASVSRVELLAFVLGRSPRDEEIGHFVRLYQRQMIEQLILYPGLLELFSFLEQRAMPWGIVTNKPKEHFAIFKQHMECVAKASCIITPQDVTHKKPHPEGLLVACQLLQTTPANTLFVGDSHADWAAAQGCNMDFAFATYGYGGQAHGQLMRQSHHQIEDLAQLRGIVG